MANLAATILGDMVATTPAFDKNEELTGLYGGLAAFMKQTKDPLGIVTPELVTMAASSSGRTLKVPVINKNTTALVGSTREVDLTGYQNTSAFQSVTFSPYTYEIEMIRAYNDTNYISYERDFRRKVEEMENKIIASLDLAACTVLSTNKTQYLIEKLGNAFASNIYSITAQQKESLFSDLKTLMTFNKFNGMIDIVANAGVKQLFDKLAQSGVNNAENKQMQYNGLNFNFSNNVANALGKGGSGYAIEAGTLGMLTRVEYDARMGNRATNGREFSVVTLPKTGIQCALYSYSEPQDKSSLQSNLERPIVEKYGFAFDAALFSAYNSAPTTIPTPIVKFDMATGDTSTLVTVVNTAANPVYVNEVVAS